MRAIFVLLPLVTSFSPLYGELTVVTAAAIKGSVQFENAPENKLTTGDTIPTGSTLITKQKGRALLKGTPGTAAGIAETSLVTITHETGEDAPQKLSLNLKEGSVMLATQKTEPLTGTVEVNTPQATATGRAALFSVSVFADQTAVTVAACVVFVSYFDSTGTQRTVKLGKGESLTIIGNRAMPINPASRAEVKALTSFLAEAMDPLIIGKVDERWDPAVDALHCSDAPSRSIDASRSIETLRSIDTRRSIDRGRTTPSAKETPSVPQASPE